MNNQINAAHRSMRNHSFMIIFALLSLLMSQFALAADKDPRVAWDKIDAGATVIDVRTAEEFAAGHLDNAINIPFEEIAAKINTLDIAKDTQIVLYCRSGRRSGIAFDTVVSEGFTQSYNGGGFETLSQFKQDDKQ